MKILTVVIMYILITIDVWAQTSKYSLEINPFVRYDRANEFYAWQTTIGGRHFAKTTGISSGINFNVHKRISRIGNMYAGLGFYRHLISGLDVRNNRGQSNQRLINYPSPTFLLFYSDKYAYNNLSLNLGYECRFKLKQNYTITTGIDVNGLYTFSQYCRLTANPDGSIHYRSRNARMLGFFAGLDVGLIKNFKRVSIGPKIKIPVFSRLKTDATFSEETDDNYGDQWLSGIGLGISVIYKLKY
ncbi:MAG: hypothetical protein EAY75_13825 [Bacteroidetes bacterium]|nr:MAG: hypothetical protein EAY75_13825 [Bacteroidota bacterium]